MIGVTDAPKPPTERISLTIPALNRSTEMWIMATGAAKAGAVRRGPARAIGGFPPLTCAGTKVTLWYLDDAAASGLPAQYSCPF